MLSIKPPDIVYPPGPEGPHRPNWKGQPLHVNKEHEGIWEATKDLPGWQDLNDSKKLYEMAFVNGAVILEVGVYGGRSAVVELRGALAACKGGGGAAAMAPQFYGVDVDPAFYARSLKSVTDAGLADYCLFFHGDLERFHRQVPIVPTMVFVDGDHRYPGVWADLRLLSTFLAPGTPVLCHDYKGIEGVTRAVDAWVAEGSFEWMGGFGCSALLRVNPARATGPGRRPGGLSPAVFKKVAADLHQFYRETLPKQTWGTYYNPVSRLTRPARAELANPSWARLASGRGAWPWANSEARTLPETMPGGRPWPRISVVTPSFNQGKYIEETVLSVLNQAYPNLEYIVIDGGSTDETLAVIGRYRGLLAHFESEKDRGQSHAINKGFERATGEILTWLNSDDMLAPGALAAAAIALHTSGADMVAGACHVYREGVLHHKHLTSCEDGPLPLDDLLDLDRCWMAGQFFFQPEVMFTRDLWKKAGGRVDESLFYSMDYELWLRFAEHGARIKVIGRPLALFRAHEQQKTAGTAEGGFRKELPKAREAFLARTAHKPAERASPAVEPKPRLRIAMFNDLAYSWGAGIAHRRLAEALVAAGHDVTVLAVSTREAEAVGRKVAGEEVVSRIAAVSPDLVVVGNLHGVGLDATVLGRIADQFPTAFIVHDMWILTGRCAYPGGCTKYLKGCDESCTCPKGHPNLDAALIQEAWQTKHRVLGSERPPFLLSNSRWTMGRVREAIRAAEPSATRTPATDWIKFGFELETLRPRDKQESRAALGLPPDAFIVMSSASALRDPRKGLAHLRRAIEILGLKDLVVTCAGAFDPTERVPIEGMRTLGYSQDLDRLAMAYSSADLFVGPSLEEAFGQVFVEAAACGTPSVGYPIGGVPEAILDGVSGRVAEEVTPEALADAIGELYGDAAMRARMAAWGRLWVENEWSMVSSYHRFACALRATGFGERIGLGRKIDLALRTPAPPVPTVIAGILPAWRSLYGFEGWEGPVPDKGLPRFRWITGPVARFELDSPGAGRARVLIGCRCFEEGQQLRLIHHGRVVGEMDVPRTAETAGDTMLSFDMDVEKGVNEFQVNLWKWNLKASRPLALMVTSISCIPAGRAPAGALPPHVEMKPQPVPT